MKKRFLSLLLILCLLVPMAAQAAGVSGYIKDQTEIMTGPGDDYYDPGMMLPYGTDVTALSRTWDDYNGVWQVLVEFRWGYDLFRGYVVNRRMYTSTSGLSSVPIEEALEKCTVIYDVDAFAGPGLTYTLWGDTVYKGTSALLLAVENGYGFIECWNGNRQKLWRVWVDLDTLSCGQKYGGGSFFDSEDWYNGAYTTPVPSYYSYLPEVPYGGITPDCGNAKSIMWMQQCLRSCGYGQLAVDGKWGNQTTTAVLKFRQDHGYGGHRAEVTYEIACDMLDMFYEKGLPLRYLQHYLPD